MKVHLDIQNASSRKQLYRRDNLTQLAERICSDEKVRTDCEISLLLCDDFFIAALNQQYRNKRGPTDVLAFTQDTVQPKGVRLLGDIVISLQTVERFCGGNREAMRAELRLLFCHGLLHLLGYTHKDEANRQLMNEKQARYLDVDMNAAWHQRR